MKGERQEILYLDMWVGERIQEMKLAGIRRFAAARGWDIVVKSERSSRPRHLAKLLKNEKPIGCIVECSAGHRDLSPDLFGPIPVVYLDCSRSLFGNHAAKVIHDGKQTVRAAFRELSSNNPSSYAIVESAAPYRNSKRGNRDGVRGCQIDLLIQTARTAYVVEVKRKRFIGEEIVAEVEEKVRRLPLRRDLSARPVLVYDGELQPSVEGTGYFDAVINARQLLEA